MNILKKIIIFYLLLLGSINSTWAVQNIFVLDTSRSVINNTSYNIMVETIRAIINKFESDSEISLFTFDEEFDALIDRQVVSKERFNEVLDGIVVDGAWTYTSLMLSELVNRLQNEETLNLFIFSDGIDDPPSNQFTNFDTYQNDNNNIFYFYYTDNPSRQRELIKSAFPNVLTRQLSSNLSEDIDSVNEIIPRAELEIVAGIEGEIVVGVEKKLIINVNANKIISGKEAILYVGADKNIFNLAPTIQNRFNLQDGINNFSFPYQIKNSFQNKTAKLFINVSLAESPEDSLDSKDITVKIAQLPFHQKLYKLPIYAIPLLIILIFILFILYRYIRYLFFIPVIKMSYQLVKGEEGSAINTVDLGKLKSGTYNISSGPDAFLVLPSLPNFVILSLIKKGKKYQTKIFIHRQSLRSLTDNRGRMLKKKQIKNGTSFYLEDYHFTFQTNI